VLAAFEQGGIFIFLHLLWHGASIFTVLSGPPHLVASYDAQADVDFLYRKYKNTVNYEDTVNEYDQCHKFYK
jgi:hypothetical protein